MFQRSSHDPQPTRLGTRLNVALVDKTTLESVPEAMVLSQIAALVSDAIEGDHNLKEINSVLGGLKLVMQCSHA